MWLETPTSKDLRLSMPDLAFELEFEFLAYSLDQLEVNYRRRTRKGSGFFELPMMDYLQLRIYPVDKASGHSEWLTWSWTETYYEDEEAKVESSIRAYVELIDFSEEAGKLIHGYTVHKQDMKSLLKMAVDGMRTDTGRYLTPLPPVRSSTRRN